MSSKVKCFDTKQNIKQSNIYSYCSMYKLICSTLGLHQQFPMDTKHHDLRKITTFISVCMYSGAIISFSFWCALNLLAILPYVNDR